MNGTKSALTVLLAAVAMISSAAFAQYPGGHGGLPGTRGGMGGGQAAQGPGKTRAQSAADTLSASGAPVLVQLDKLEDDLKFTPQQRAAWNAYADKVLRLADDMTRSRFAARTSTPLTEGTAAQQLDQLAGSTRNRLTAVEEIVEAGKVFYATLTVEQKTIADRKLVVPMLSLTTGASPPGMSRTSPTPVSWPSATSLSPIQIRRICLRLPFFFGRNVFTALEGRTCPGDSGRTSPSDDVRHDVQHGWPDYRDHKLSDVYMIVCRPNVSIALQTTRRRAWERTRTSSFRRLIPFQLNVRGEHL